MWGLNHQEGWVPKNWCFWTVVLEKTLESPLDCKEIQPVDPKGNQSWIFIGRTDAEAETRILWPPAAKNWLIWKDPDAAWCAAVHGVAKSRKCLSDWNELSWAICVTDLFYNFSQMPCLPPWVSDSSSVKWIDQIICVPIPSQSSYTINCAGLFVLTGFVTGCSFTLFTSGWSVWQNERKKERKGKKASSKEMKIL